MRTRLILILLLAVLSCNISSAQRRSRPSSMKHSEAELVNATKITKIYAKYIRDGNTFTGNVYIAEGGVGIEVGKASIAFRNGKYSFSFGSGTMKTRKASTRADRQRQGITESEYENSWKEEKIGEDFDYSGKYEVVKQFNVIHLILYNKDSDNVFAKIELTSADDNSFEFTEGGMLIKMKLKQ